MSNVAHIDRSAARMTPARIRYEDGGSSMQYGNGPIDLLARKFEETNVGPDEGLYDDYARDTLTNWGPDTTAFAHEESRGAVNRQAGLLQTRYYGHRGCEDVDRPEMFLGFAGPENHDPRGINVDPDMRALRAQSEARNRFIRLTPDDSAFVTGGGRSEGQLMADQQSLRRFVRDRLKVFDRQMDGRREGLRRTVAQTKSVAQITELVQSYGDLVRDYALNPQRRANIICRQAIRDSRAWRDGTADQDWQFAKYTQICRRAKTRTTFKRVLEARAADDNAWTDGDATVSYKAMGLLMSAIIAAKRNASGAVASGDRDYGTSTEAAARKTAAPSRDLEALMYAIVAGGEFGSADETVVGKTAAPQKRAHLARVQDAGSHLTPAHHYLNAELVYKTLRQGGDLSKIQQHVVGDAVRNDTSEDTVAQGKAASVRRVAGAKLAIDYDTDRSGDNVAVYSYKSVKPKTRPHDALVTATDARHTESDATQSRQTQKTNYRITSTKDVDVMGDFLDNASKERRKAPVGRKYTMREVDRDGRLSDLA